MLVLSRKVNEEIVIDGRITVRIVGLQGGRVRIGISAPKEVAVQRGELLQRDAELTLEEVEVPLERLLCRSA